MLLNNSEDTASKLVVSILDMESFFGFILSDSMIFNSFFNYTFICKKLVSELRRFGTTEVLNRYKYLQLLEGLNAKRRIPYSVYIIPNQGSYVQDHIRSKKDGWRHHT